MKIGITGHQNIGAEEVVSWVISTLNALVSEYSIDMGLTCLARGADQIYATILLEHGISYIAIIASADYQETFKEAEHLTQYLALREEADEVIVLDHQIATEDAFWDAGKRLVDLSDMIFAVWNGEPAKGLGGTGDVVQYALEQKKQVIHLNTKALKIHHL